MAKPKGKLNITNEITEKLNTLALSILEELLEAKRSNKPVDLNDFKTFFIAIKEIKDLVKINKKDEMTTWGEMFIEDEINSVYLLEEEQDEKRK